MRIGIDFDNTLVCYDSLFHKLALEQGLIPADLPANKTAVRNYLRAQNLESEWTRMQGLAYGPRITEASPFPHMQDCLRIWQDKGWEICIVSHKTLTPFAGESHDLHSAARNWIHVHLHQSGLLQDALIFFEVTRSAKLQRVASLELDCFIDDLPDILNDLDQKVARRLLFDPHNQYLESTSQTSFEKNQLSIEHWPGWQQLQCLTP